MVKGLLYKFGFWLFADGKAQTMVFSYGGKGRNHFWDLVFTS